MRAGELLLQLVYPRRCPVCDGIVTPFGEKICFSCLPGLKLLTPPWCMHCGKKLTEEGEYCADCRNVSHQFVRGRALYEYEGAAQAIYRFKYGGRREYAEFFGEEIVSYLGDFIRDVSPDALIPIPLHKKRLQKRGYNQAALLAEQIGRRCGVPVDDKYVRRVRNTTPLKLLNPAERQNNLKKAFLIARNDVKLKVVILIDDIYTTGSTMDAVAALLKEHGTERVYFLAVACGGQR